MDRFTLVAQLRATVAAADTSAEKQEAADGAR
jgi:hypothetical protein